MGVDSGRGGGCGWAWQRHLVDSHHRHPLPPLASLLQVLAHSRGVVSVSQLVTDAELIAKSEAFESVVAGGAHDKEAMQNFCTGRAATSQVWGEWRIRVSDAGVGYEG